MKFSPLTGWWGLGGEGVCARFDVVIFHLFLKLPPLNNDKETNPSEFLNIQEYRLSQQAIENATIHCLIRSPHQDGGRTIV